MSGPAFHQPSHANPSQPVASGISLDAQGEFWTPTSSLRSSFLPAFSLLPFPSTPVHLDLQGCATPLLPRFLMEFLPPREVVSLSPYLVGWNIAIPSNTHWPGPPESFGFCSEYNRAAGMEPWHFAVCNSRSCFALLSLLWMVPPCVCFGVSGAWSSHCWLRRPRQFLVPVGSQLCFLPPPLALGSLSVS